MQTREAGDQTSDLPINGRPALPPKLSLTYDLCRSDSVTGQHGLTLESVCLFYYVLWPCQTSDVLQRINE